MASFEEMLRTHDSTETTSARREKRKAKLKRENKNRPMEVSSKVPPKIEFDIPVRKPGRDPRFDPFCVGGPPVDTDPKRERLRQIREQHIAKERDAVAHGKRPFYLSKSAAKKALLMEQFQELTESGRLEAALAKRRAKNAARDRRYLPSRRTSSSGAGNS